MNFHIFFSTGIYHSLVSYAKIIISLYLREKWGKKRPQPVLVTVLFYFTKIALLNYYLLAVDDKYSLRGFAYALTCEVVDGIVLSGSLSVDVADSCYNLYILDGI